MTSNLSDWESTNGDVAYPHFNDIVSAISEQHPLLGKYVHRYFDDIKLYLQSLRKVVTPKARCFYIVGNSKFYDTMLPVEEIYATPLEDAGFRNVGWKAIRKRNSKRNCSSSLSTRLCREKLDESGKQPGCNLFRKLSCVPASPSQFE